MFEVDRGLPRSTEAATGKWSFFARPEGSGSLEVKEIVGVDAPQRIELVAGSDSPKYGKESGHFLDVKRDLKARNSTEL